MTSFDTREAGPGVRTEDTTVALSSELLLFMPSLWNAHSLSSNHSTWSSFNHLDPIRLVLAVLLSISLFLIPLERKIYSEGLDHLRERLSPRSAGRKEATAPIIDEPTNDEQPVAETRPSSSSSVSSNSSSTMLESAAKVDRPLNELLSNSTVDIWVGPGPDTTHYNIHEKLLCHHSPFFRRVFYGDKSESKKSKVFGLEEEDDATFEMFVGWLYSRSLRTPTQESEVGPLLDLYLMAVKFEIEALETDVVEAIRTFYYNNNSYPGLRRVQYIYSNTDDDNAMREMMVSSVARYLTLADKIPAHWENALKKNGQLAVDIIRSIQEWHLDNRSVPDARDASADRGRAGKFADVQSLPEGESFDSGNDLKFNGEAEE